METLTISDEDFQHFAGTSGLINAWDMYDEMTHTFCCETCGRLHVFRNGLAGDPTVYAPEV